MAVSLILFVFAITMILYSLVNGLCAHYREEVEKRVPRNSTATEMPGEVEDISEPVQHTNINATIDSQIDCFLSRKDMCMAKETSKEYSDCCVKLSFIKKKNAEMLEAGHKVNPSVKSLHIKILPEVLELMTKYEKIVNSPRKEDDTRKLKQRMRNVIVNLLEHLDRVCTDLCASDDLAIEVSIDLLDQALRDGDDTFKQEERDDV